MKLGRNLLTAASVFIGAAGLSACGDNGMERSNDLQRDITEACPDEVYYPNRIALRDARYASYRDRSDATRAKIPVIQEAYGGACETREWLEKAIEACQRESDPLGGVTFDSGQERLFDKLRRRTGLDLSCANGRAMAGPFDPDKAL